MMRKMTDHGIEGWYNDEERDEFVKNEIPPNPFPQEQDEPAALVRGRVRFHRQYNVQELIRLQSNYWLAYKALEDVIRLCKELVRPEEIRRITEKLLTYLTKPEDV